MFPPEIPISADAHSLVTTLCSDATVRPGSFADIKEHSFFRGVDWEHIRDRPAAIPIRVRNTSIGLERLVIGVPSLR